MKSRNKIKIEKNILESRKLLQNWEKIFTMEKYFVARVEKKSWIQWPRIQWTYLLNKTKDEIKEICYTA